MTISRVNPGNWGLDEVFTSAQLNTLDTNVSHAVDKTSLGDTVSGVIQLIGSGAIDGYSSGVKVKASVSGASIEATASGSKIRISNGATFEIGTGSTAPTFQTPVPRTLGKVIHPVAGLYTPADWNVTLGGVTGHFATSKLVCSLNDVLHDGATLGSVTIQLLPNAPYISLPTTFPRFQIARVSILGTYSYLNSTDTLSPTAGSTGAWDAATSFTYACNQNNVINRANYNYFLTIIDENGGGAQGVTYTGAVMNYTSIADLRFA